MLRLKNIKISALFLILLFGLNSCDKDKIEGEYDIKKYVLEFTIDSNGTYVGAISDGQWLKHGMDSILMVNNTDISTVSKINLKSAKIILNGQNLVPLSNLKNIKILFRTTLFDQLIVAESSENLIAEDNEIDLNAKSLVDLKPYFKNESFFVLLSSTATSPLINQLKLSVELDISLTLIEN